MTSRPKPAPRFDPIAGALAGATMRVAPDRQDDILAWVTTYGRWLQDESSRSRAHGAVALHLIDTYTPAAVSFDIDPARAGWSQAAGVREAITAWADAPTDDNRAAARRAARGAYDAQNTRRFLTNWIARRGIIAAAKVASKAPHNVDGIMEAITWDHQTREAFYGRLWDVRHELDHVRAAEVETPLAAESGPLGVLAREMFTEQQDTLLQELHDRYAREYPEIGIQHLPTLLACLHAYQGGLGASARPVGQVSLMTSHEPPTSTER